MEQIRRREQMEASEELRIDVEDCTLLIPDLHKPVWFGPYHDGKLGIYETTVLVKESVPCDIPEGSVTYAGILTDTAAGNNFVFYATYDKSSDVNAICAHLQNVVYSNYQKQLGSIRPESYAPSTDTLQ